MIGFAPRFKSRLSASASSGPTPPIPSNNILLVFGDSRGALGSSSTSVLRTVARGIGHLGCIPTLEPRIQLAGDWTNADGATTLGNFGVSAQRSASYILDPRPGAAEKAMKWAALHPACIISLFGVINNFSQGAGIAASLTDVVTFINYVTNPANCGGLQKVVVALDETPVGVALDGTTTNALSPTVAQQLRDYATSLRALDYRQSGGHPYLVVAPVYETFLDPASGSNLRNYQGLLPDGIHGGNASSTLFARAIKTAIAPVLAAAGFADTVATRLASASNSAFLNTNPRLTGTGGAVSGGLTLTSGSIPTGWTLQRLGTGTLSVVSTTRTNANGEIEYGFAFTWSGATSMTAFFFSNQTKAGLLATGFAVGDQVGAAGLIKIDTGSVNMCNAGLRATVTSTVGANSFTTTSIGAAGSATTGQGILTFAGFDAGGDQLAILIPPIPTAQVTNSGGDFSATTAVQIAASIAFGDGSGAATVWLAQLTAFKV